MASLMLAAVVAAGCATEHGEPHPQDFRCRIAKSDGTCESMPANCPVTLPPSIQSDEPHCPLGAQLIPIADDDCARELICTD